MSIRPAGKVLDSTGIPYLGFYLLGLSLPAVLVVILSWVSPENAVSKVTLFLNRTYREQSI
jgi:hypothetical protein